MRAADLDDLMAALVRDRLDDRWALRGTSLTLDDPGGAQLELRRWSFRGVLRYVALYRHRFLRGVMEDTPPLRPHDPDAFPICIHPLRLGSLLDPGWSIPPFTLDRTRRESLDLGPSPLRPAVVEPAMGAAVDLLRDHADAIVARWTPGRVLAALDRARRQPGPGLGRTALDPRLPRPPPPHLTCGVVAGPGRFELPTPSPK